jgi:AraC-like DNA-binding protein
MSRRIQKDDPVIAQCQVWIAENYAVSHPITQALQLSGLPQRTFNRRFEAATGYRPMEYVQTVRIEEAKQLLETTCKPIDEISHEVGYQDPRPVSRLFARKTGLSPVPQPSECSIIHPRAVVVSINCDGNGGNVITQCRVLNSTSPNCCHFLDLIGLCAGLTHPHGTWQFRCAGVGGEKWLLSAHRRQRQAATCAEISNPALRSMPPIPSGSACRSPVRNVAGNCA